MQIAIIGAGNVGGALAASFIKTGHQVVLIDHKPEDAQQLASQVGGSAAPSLADAASADVVVLAVPFTAVESVAKELAGKLGGKIVVDATNPLKPDYSDLATVGGPSGAELVQQWLPEAKVVKAFNTVFASRQASPTVAGQQVDAFVAGNDDSAKQTIGELAASAGFEPIDVGPLARSRQLEELAFLSILLQVQKNGDWQAAWKLLSPPPAAVLKSQPANTFSRN